MNVEFDLVELFVKNLNNEKSKVVKCKNKSEVFRVLYDLGMNVNEISREGGCHFSFVYGVVSKGCKMREKKSESKSDVIRKMVLDGKSCGEISKELNSNYSFVFSVVKKYKNSDEYKKIEKVI